MKGSGGIAFPLTMFILLSIGAVVLWLMHFSG